MNFDIGEVFACGLVFDFKILCRDVADFAAVSTHGDFNGVIFEGEIGFGYVYWDTRESLVYYLVMNPARIDGDA